MLIREKGAKASIPAPLHGWEQIYQYFIIPQLYLPKNNAVVGGWSLTSSPKARWWALEMCLTTVNYLCKILLMTQAMTSSIISSFSQGVDQYTATLGARTYESSLLLSSFMWSPLPLEISWDYYNGTTVQEWMFYNYSARFLYHILIQNKFKRGR